jgi:hypothetical protein
LNLRVEEKGIDVATKELETARVEETPSHAWLIGLAAWAVPGLGHFLQRRWIRGVLLGGAVWTMFLTGLALGGHLFTIGGPEEGLAALVPALWMTGNIGSGLLYIFCWLMNIGFVDTSAAAARLTFEYGNTFLVVAGLINYLAMLDAFDIAAGRKK